MPRFLPIRLLVAFLPFVSAPALAQDETVSFRFLDEARLGAYVHSPNYKEGETAAINAEFLTSRLPSDVANPFLRFFLTPRFHVGGTANLEGQTSYLYSGLTFTQDLWKGLFFEASFGGGIHNGKLDPPTGADRLTLGCRALFRESAGLGYHFTNKWTALVTVEHLSHAGLCSDYNNGVTDAGLRIGYHF
jgi:lipid A 3-O-deacylase